MFSEARVWWRWWNGGRCDVGGGDGGGSGGGGGGGGRRPTRKIHKNREKKETGNSLGQNGNTYIVRERCSAGGRVDRVV